jgi:hypothetical protein
MASLTTIVRYRGDTVPDSFSLQNPDGTPLDLVGSTFKMTVNRTKDPLNITQQLYELIGVIVDAPGGMVWFIPSQAQSDQLPGRYFYDVQRIDVSGLIHTIRKGTYKYKQDITKSIV